MVRRASMSSPARRAPRRPFCRQSTSTSGNTSNFLPFTGNMSATQGTLTALTGLSGYTGAAGNGPGYGLSWQSGNISVTSGEVIYFVADPESHRGAHVPRLTRVPRIRSL